MAKRKEENPSVVSDILFALRKNWILILIVVLLSGIIGGVYAKVRKPEYIVKQSVNYYVETKTDKPKDQLWYTNNINFMTRYVDTAIAFCQTEIVLDRAEEYYNQYLKGDVKLMEYLQSEDINAKREFVKKEVENKGPVPARNKKEAHFVTSRIGSYTYSNEDLNTGYVFEISYREGNKEDAKVKAKILILASAVEGKDFFSGVDTYLEDLGTLSVSLDMSITKIMVIALLIGVALACILVYIKNAMDYTVKTKEDLEQITGASVLACIEKQEELTEKYAKNKKRGNR